MDPRLPVVIIKSNLCGPFIESYTSSNASKTGTYTKIQFRVEESINEKTLVICSIRSLLLNSSDRPIITVIPVETRDDIGALYASVSLTVNLCEVFDKPESNGWNAARHKIAMYINWYETGVRPGINVYTGPMYAGKSTALIKYNKTNGYPIVQTKLRQHYDWVSQTHGGEKFKHMFFHNTLFPADMALTTDCDLTTSAQWDMYAEILKRGGLCIDEFQFLELRDEDYVVLDNLARNGINIQIAILSGNFLRTPWSAFGRILAIADTVEHLKANCYRCGAPAPFSKKLSSNPTLIEMEKALYVPSCRVCHEFLDN